MLQCLTCAAFWPTSQNMTGSVGGDCRRYAKVAGRDWPKVTESEFCLEHREHIITQRETSPLSRGYEKIREN